MTESLQSIPFLIAFAAQNLLMFYLTGRIMENRVNKRWSIPLAILNSIFFVLLLNLYPDSLSILYLSLTIILILQMVLLFKGNVSVVISCALAIPIHLMGIRNVVVSSYVLIDGANLIQVLKPSELFWNTFSITSILCSSFIMMVLLIIPDKYFKMMNQDVGRMTLFLAFSGIATINLIVNSLEYRSEYLVNVQPIQQISIGVSWMLVFYTGVFMLVGFDLIDENKDKLQQRLARERMYRKALLSNSVMTLEVNCDTDLLSYVTVNGSVKESLIGSSYSEYIVGHIQATIHTNEKLLLRKHILLENLRSKFSAGETDYVIEYRKRQTSGEYEWHRAAVSLEMNKETDQLNAIINIENINEEKLKAIELKYKAERDQLVGLYNKVTIERLINDHIVDGGAGTLLMIDLDNFKSINDNFGHSYGDKVLCEVSEKLNQLFRDNDLIGRVGGDEFVVFIKDASDMNAIADKTKMVCNSLKKTYYYQGDNGITVSSSVGVACSPKYGQNFKELFDNADVAMYESKNNGKNTYKIFDETMLKNIKRRVNDS